MKLKSLLFVFCTALFFNSLLADPVHVGSDLPYSIGTPETPIPASEFCEFLNTKDHTPTYFQYTSKYYDIVLKGAIKQTWVQENSFATGHFEYQVVPGHENDVIDGVHDQSVQQEFNTWEKPREEARALAQQKDKEKKAAEEKAAADKAAEEQAAEQQEQAELAKNPTRAELRDMINYQLAARIDLSYLDKAQEIEQHYPDTAVSHFLPPSSIITDYYTYTFENDAQSGSWEGSWKDQSDWRHSLDPNVSGSQSGSWSFPGHSTRVTIGVGVYAESPAQYQWYDRYMNVYDERPVWDQVEDLMHADDYDFQKNSCAMMDIKGNLYTTVTHDAASDEDLNGFLKFWGLQIVEESDSSLGLPLEMSKHIALIDQSSGDERKKWAMLIPLVESPLSNGQCSPFDGFQINHSEKVYPTSHYIIPVSETERKVYWKPVP